MKKLITIVLIIGLVLGVIVGVAADSIYLQDSGPLLIEDVEIHSMPCVLAYYKGYIEVGGLTCKWDEYVPPTPSWEVLRETTD